MARWGLKDADIAKLLLCKRGANRQRVFLLKSADDSDAAADRQVPTTLTAPLMKEAGADWRTAYVPVAVPGAEEDQGQFPTGDGDVDVWLTEDEIAKAAHSFMRNGQALGADQHFDGKLAEGVRLVESAVALNDFEVNGQQIAKGTWYVGMEFTDAQLREQVDAGEIDAVSVEGFATRELLGKDAALVPNKPGKTNWVQEAGGLPKFIADIAGDLITERGKTTSQAIQLAVGIVRNWCHGHGGNVSATTRAKACAAAAEWEAKKARAHVGKEAWDTESMDTDCGCGAPEQEPTGFWAKVAKSLGIDGTPAAPEAESWEPVDEEWPDGDDHVALAKAQMSFAERKKLPKSSFVYPDKAPGSGSYPIHDRAHAANALARASGKPEYAAVRAAVCKRFSDLPACKKVGKEALLDDPGSVQDVELNERVEQLEKRLTDLSTKLVGTEEEPGAIAKLGEQITKLAEKSDKDDTDDKKDREPVAKQETVDQLNASLDKLVEEQLLPLAKRIDDLEEGDSAQPEGEPVAKSSADDKYAGILFP